MSETTTRRLGGVAEVAEENGVARQTVSMWDARRDSNGFPEAVAELAMGPVYDLDEVRAWRQRAGLKAGGVE